MQREEDLERKKDNAAYLQQEYERSVHLRNAGLVNQRLGDVKAEERAQEQIQREMGQLANAEQKKKWLMKEALRGGTDDIK